MTPEQRLECLRLADALHSSSNAGHGDVYWKAGDLLRTLAAEPKTTEIPGGRKTCQICGKSFLRGLYWKHDCEGEQDD